MHWRNLEHLSSSYRACASRLARGCEREAKLATVFECEPAELLKVLSPQNSNAPPERAARLSEAVDCRGPCPSGN
jgi:hypothetical protein